MSAHPAFVHPFDVAASPGSAEPPVRVPALGQSVDLGEPLAGIAAWFGLATPRLYVSDRRRHAAGPGVIVIGPAELDLAPDEIAAVLAHECGHLVLRHFAIDPSLHPERAQAGEFSADRAAALYAGSADAITRAIFHEAARADVHSGPSPFDVRIREIQAWTATAGFAQLAESGTTRTPAT